MSRQDIPEEKRRDFYLYVDEFQNFATPDFAQILSEAGIPLKEKLDWTTKNARATAQFLAHTIETAETMIAFELACREEGTLARLRRLDRL